MKPSADVIDNQQKNKRRRTMTNIKNMDGIKYFHHNQIQLLRRTVKEKAELAKINFGLR